MSSFDPRLPYITGQSDEAVKVSFMRRLYERFYELWRELHEVIERAIVQDINNTVSIPGRIFFATTTNTTQTSSAWLACTGVPSNANGSDGDWCSSDNGHIYFKTGGAWVAKV